MFDAPVAASQLKPKDIEGHLLIVEPIEYVANMATTMGESDAVKCNVHDVTTATYHPEILWFSKVLVSTLKGQTGKRLLAVMGKGLAKPGQSAPWVLEDATQDAKLVKQATDYLNKATASTLTAPKAASDELSAALDNLADITA
jgi:hypothetical protein